MRRSTTLWEESVSEPQPKSFDIFKRLVWEAYRKVAANKGATGVDGESIQQFGADLKGNEDYAKRSLKK